MIGLRGRHRGHRELLVPSGFALILDGGPHAPRQARDGIRERLREELDAETLYTLRLLVSELVSNCVEHALASGSSSVEVSVSLPPGALHVEVSTAAPPFQYRPSAAGPPQPSESRGRGLYIVDRLSQRWGIKQREANTVWFELAVA